MLNIAIGRGHLPADELGRTDSDPSYPCCREQAMARFNTKKSRQSEPHLCAIFLSCQVRNVGMTLDLATSHPAKQCTRLLDASDTHAILQHFTGLSPHDRFFRFCGALSEFAIERFVKQYIGRRDHLFIGYFETTSLMGVAHLAPSDSIAGEYELALSVDPDFRRRGTAIVLARTAMEFAVERNALCLRLSTSVENKPMISLAREIGFEMRVINSLVKGQLLFSSRHRHYGVSNPVIRNRTMCTEASRRSY